MNGIQNNIGSKLNVELKKWKNIQMNPSDLNFNCWLIAHLEMQLQQLTNKVTIESSNYLRIQSLTRCSPVAGFVLRT